MTSRLPNLVQVVGIQNNIASTICTVVFSTQQLTIPFLYLFMHWNRPANPQQCHLAHIRYQAIHRVGKISSFT